MLPCRHHAWVSFEAMAEAYNEVNRVTENDNTTLVAKFLKSHPLRASDEGIHYPVRAHAHGGVKRSVSSSVSLSVSKRILRNFICICKRHGLRTDTAY